MTGDRPAVCPRCGQLGNEPPGLRLGEFDGLDAVFVGDEPVPAPQRLQCLNCGEGFPVPRGSIAVRPMTGGAS